MIRLSEKIETIKGIGPKISKIFHKIKINSIWDLINYYPRKWIDLSDQQEISKSRINDIIIIKASILNLNIIHTPRKHITIIKATLENTNGESINAVWFNQPFLINILKEKSIWIFIGKIGYDFSSREKNLLSPKYFPKEKIISIYPETEGINSKLISKLLCQILKNVKINDFLPLEIIKSENLIDNQNAIKEIHFPKNKINLLKAKQRLAFNEIFFLILKMKLKKNRFAKYLAPKISIDNQKSNQFINLLPFKLTKDQNKAILEILNDLSTSKPMTRLLNGDVGSGKTVVAALASLQIFLNGLRTIFMAPTEILALQHYKTFTKLFCNNFNIKISLITSSIKLVSNNKIKSPSIKNIISSDIIIGTHSLIQDSLKINNVGLIIVDEEHRFGVNQRLKLFKQHCDHKNIFPHYLAMSATPIPRTLAISIYGDLDVSTLNELPAGRKKIITKLVNQNDRQKAYDFITKQIKSGRQVFVICPLIENKNSKLNLIDLDRKSVKKEYEKLRNKIFSGFKIKMLHGRLKSLEKNSIMTDFSNGKIDILISTSVVEVGVDVPNANIMLIEDADRFGLSQLHQFRGRVGRGKHQSFCFLMTNSTNLDSIKRLKAMQMYSDGFKLANIDLSTRGPGEIIGDRQSGFNQLKIANLTDIMTLNKAIKIANLLIKNDINSYKSLKTHLKTFS